MSGTKQVYAIFTEQKVINPSEGLKHPCSSSLVFSRSLYYTALPRNYEDDMEWNVIVHGFDIDNPQRQGNHSKLDHSIILEGGLADIPID